MVGFIAAFGSAVPVRAAFDVLPSVAEVPGSLTGVPVTTGTPLVAGGGEAEPPVVAPMSVPVPVVPPELTLPAALGSAVPVRAALDVLPSVAEAPGSLTGVPVTTGTPLVAGGGEVESPVVALVPVPVVPSELTLPVALGSAVPAGAAFDVLPSVAEVPGSLTGVPVTTGTPLVAGGGEAESSAVPAAGVSQPLVSG